MKRKIIAFLTIMLVLISNFGISNTASAEVIHETQLEEYIMKEMSNANILGLGISIVSSDKELYCASYGMSKETGEDYVLGSLTKPIIAAGIMHLVDDGELDYETTVGEILPEYKNIANVTVEQLINQISGIGKYETMDNITASGKSGSFEDSNANYNLLGLIIEKVTGMSCEEYLSDNLFDSLKMSSTFSLKDAQEYGATLAKGFRTYFGFPMAMQSTYDETDEWMQDASQYMVSDIRDMGRFAQLFLSGGDKIISQKSADSIFNDGTDVNSDKIVSSELLGDNGTYSRGFIKTKIEGSDVVYCMGETQNYTTCMMLLPERNIAITLMFDSADKIIGEKLIRDFAKGIVTLELEGQPAAIDGSAYLIQHAIIDVAIVIIALFSWLPIFLIGKWKKRRRKKLFRPVVLIKDILINIVLPTALLVVTLDTMPIFVAEKFVPDLFYSVLFIVASLYLGALIKILMMIVIAVKGPVAENKDMEIANEEKKTDKTVVEPASVEKKADKTVVEPASVEKKAEEAVVESASMEKKTEKAVVEPVSVEKKAQEAVVNPASVEKKAEEAVGEPADEEK